MPDDEITISPSPFQKKMLWSAITAVSIVVLAAIVLGLIWLGVKVMSFLQPVLVPLAVAGVFSYLLQPLVYKLVDKRGMHRKRAALIVFIGFVVAASAVMAAIAIPLAKQAGDLARNFPTITKKFDDIIDKRLSPAALNETYDRATEIPWLGGLIELLPLGGEEDAEGEPVAPPEVEEPTPAPPEPLPAPPGGELAPPEPLTPDAAPGDPEEIPEIDLGNFRGWFLAQIPVVARKLWGFLKSSVGGFFGAAGFLIGFFLVPVYVFFFLREAEFIRENWTRYLPLRASPLKSEIASLLAEINGYLIAYFRGQILVSLINGLITAVLLSIIGLDFALVLGLMVGILGVIPYLGILITFIPAVIIAVVQGAGGDWYMWADAPWWVLPAVVTAIFVAVNNLDGIFIAPRIVGEAVGLHPLIIIVSVLGWFLLLGGLLGAILAVPLTATVLVFFRRYVWERRLKPGTLGGADSDNDGIVDADDPTPI